MKKKSEKTWEEQFDRITEDNDGHFGHNVEVNKKYLKKLLSVGEDIGALEVLDEYTIRITLPSCGMIDPVYRENMLLHLLTYGPIPSKCIFNKKKDQLTVEWHY